MKFIKMLILFFIILFATKTFQYAYEVNGEPERNPIPSDCAVRNFDCVGCIKMGCFYYLLSPIITKSICFPAHERFPRGSGILVDKVYKHENHCPPKIVVEEMTTPPAETGKNEVTANSKNTEAINIWTMILITFLVLGAIALITLITRCVWKKRNSSSVTSTERKIYSIQQNPTETIL